jgi:trehalose 6-phosphate synthase
MRLTLRLVILLVAVTAAVGILFALFEARSDRRALFHEIENRAESLGPYVQDHVELLLAPQRSADLQNLLSRVETRAGLFGIAVYDDQGNLLTATSGLSQELNHTPSVVVHAISSNAGRSEFLTLRRNSLFLYALPLHRGPSTIGAACLFYDASYIDATASRDWRNAIDALLIEAFLIALITFLLIRWGFAQPVARMAQWIHEMHKGAALMASPLPQDGLLQPLAKEVERIAKTLSAARATAEEEARLRASAQSLWTAERLRIHVRNKLRDSPLFVISNREPYSHVRSGKSPQVVVPPSGLVTAIEPILLACDGTWIAHGSGDADRETVDANDRLRVPPRDPRYTLRRVWLSAEEEDGYYFGFANEGLWPLCHIAYARPLFRTTDWEYYKSVNQKFAKAALEEMKRAESPVVLVQDYHFALLPLLIKSERPDARVAIFWHIPWPNPQAFGICPWQRELLEGLLGADLIGFHIQTHCNYFVESVDAALESRIDWDHFAVSRGGHRTLVRRYPISVAFTGVPAGPSLLAQLDRPPLLESLGVQALFLGVGVDRVDYTKGIPERFRAIERFLEKYPLYYKQFTFVQIAPPSRTHIPRYQELMIEVKAEADRINDRFAVSGWKPIVLLGSQHSHEEIDAYYKAADLCMVTSLDDGMNLVAKEFVAARDDEQGVLILSRFTGAARELRDALLVNPYDTDQLAEAIRMALEMSPEERQARMQRMRRLVKEHNVYRWAASLISDLVEIRPEAAWPPPAPETAEKTESTEKTDDSSR